MVVGDKFKFFIPSNLGYGDRAAGKISPGSLLIFEVTLLEVL
jgi:peptidylprolyl isomerase